MSPYVLLNHLEILSKLIVTEGLPRNFKNNN